jgi:serine/threonine protein kinase
LGRWSGAEVALKFCKEKEGLEDFWKEANLMIELPPHPNVVRVFGISRDGLQPILVLEYCAGGSLDKLFFVDEQPMNETQKITLVKGIAAGMLHLHNHNIIHRDLAARNILLSDTGHPKISDFGMSRILQKEDEGKTKTNIGPIRWMAPESLAKRTYSKKSDVWSFGIVVYEIVARCEPHTDADPLLVGALIRDQYLTPKIPDDCPSILRELMQLCWQAEPNQRPSFKEICRVLGL